jgi:hypothetical protein
MNKLVSEMLEDIDKAKSREEKIALLRQYKRPDLISVLRINYDPNLVMDLPEGEPPYKKELDVPMGMSHTSLLKEVRRFYIWLDKKTNLPKIKKESLFINMLEGLHWTEAEALILAKDRKLTKKYKTIKEDLVREAFPYALPPTEEVEKPAPKKAKASRASSTT